MKHLEAMRVPYTVIVERQEFDAYAKHIDPAKLLVLDPEYQRKYDDLVNDGGPKGSGPARNFAWDDALKRGAKWHWVMDDNIRGFYRLYRNRKVPMGDGTCFKVMEDFCLRYRNIAMAGPQYYMFAPARVGRLPPFVLNTRIYSCNLIRNDVPFRWRGRYNEDTDLSLRMLKAGWVTVQFNAFLQKKEKTGLVKGGNEEIYKMGTLPKSRMLVATHSDVARMTYRFGRVNHFVDYRPFAKNRLVRKAGVEIPAGANDYGLTLQKRCAT